MKALLCIFCACVLSLSSQTRAEKTVGAALRTSTSGNIQNSRPHSPPLHSFDRLALSNETAGVLPPRGPGSGHAGIENREAVIPPQCYTKTEGRFNPCYVCHQNHISERENMMNDGHLQRAYSFSDAGLTNHWYNLFEDRTERVAAISDDAIRSWINTDNFSALADRLEVAHFRGYIPKLANLADGAAAFDTAGFAKDGSGWVAFNYKPFPSTFWPTNGSTDDVMIRLPEKFRQTADGQTALDVYLANLAIVEMAIKGLESISCPPIDEAVIGQDLSGDGMIGMTSHVLRPRAYVGAALPETVVAHVYPLGTEFLHTVRYVGVTDEGDITPSRRMKEVRYMRKRDFLSPRELASLYDQEYQEKLEGTLPHYPDWGHAGLYNKMGWLVQGFIEDTEGRLRLNTYEENMYCMGCHTTVGSTIDKTFSFPRKVEGAQGWGYIQLRGMPDAPSVGEERGEILTYLERVGGGSEFRSNPEMEQRWYHEDGSVDTQAVLAAPDVYTLITPSPGRALLLNKAYRTVVEDQDFISGREVGVTPPKNVFDLVDEKIALTLPPDKIYKWDILLDWSQTAR